MRRKRPSLNGKARQKEASDHQAQLRLQKITCHTQPRFPRSPQSKSKAKFIHCLYDEENRIDNQNDDENLSVLTAQGLNFFRLLFATGVHVPTVSYIFNVDMISWR
jgi:hypothetical protein